MKIGITAWGSISALGSKTPDIWDNYLDNRTLLSYDSAKAIWLAKIQDQENKALAKIQTLDKNYISLDRSVLMGMYAAGQAVKNANWKEATSFGINIGSSRGATGIWEHFHTSFVQNKNTSPLASPMTTLGNISSWIGHYLKNESIQFSHSITCSTALHSLLNAISWIEAGFSDRFLAGGSEAPLTPFTVAQMQALRIYSKAHEDDVYPCRSLDVDKAKNTMVLGEGAACFCLEKNPAAPIAWIKGMGYGTEYIKHSVDLSENGLSLQKSMAMALQNIKPEQIDVIITHTPGTIKGDRSEMNAIQNTFKTLPLVTTNKWKIGHTLGASGALSLEMALLMLKNNQFINIPFYNNNNSKNINNILINTTGFGGNAVSIVVGK